MIRRSGHYPITVRQISEADERATRLKIKIKPLAGLCQQLGAMLKAGVPVAQTLSILKDQTEDNALRLILTDVHTQVQQGKSLFSAFGIYKDNFPASFLNMVEAGEATGSLDMCMERAGIAYGRTAKLNRKLKSAMMYPSVLLVLIIVVVAAMLIFVIPQFVTMFEGSDEPLPALTQMLVNFSDLMVARWYLFLVGIIVIVATVKLWLASDKGRTTFDAFKLRIPVVSKMLVKVYAARYARTLTSLHAAGVPLIQALGVTARSISNRYIEKELYKIAEAVSQGESLSHWLEKTGFMPTMIVYLTRLGEESGMMDQLLDQAAEFYDDESDSALTALTAMMEPLLIIVMAIVILPIVLAIILPVFNMYGAM